MEQSPSWKAKSSSAVQEIHYILWNSKVCYHAHNSSSPVLIHSQMNPVYSHPLFNLLPSSLYHPLKYCLPSMPTSSSGLLPSCFLTRTLCAFLFSIVCATTGHPILLDVITLIMFGKQYKSWSSSLCNFP